MFVDEDENKNRGKHDTHEISHNGTALPDGTIVTIKLEAGSGVAGVDGEEFGRSCLAVDVLDLNVKLEVFHYGDGAVRVGGCDDTTLDEC